MATEHIVDLARCRYADREYTGVLPEGPSEAEKARSARQAAALARLREKAAAALSGPCSGMCTDRDLADLLTVLGLDG